MNRVLGCLALSVAIIGCDSTGPEIEVEDFDFPGIKLATPSAVNLSYDPIVVQPEGSGGQMMSSGRLPARVQGADGQEYLIVQVAQVEAPTVTRADGSQWKVQANDVIIDGNRAYASYNYQGTPWAGAVQIIDISTPDNPAVVGDEIHFEHMDINALGLDGTDLLITGAADPSVQPDPQDPLFIAFAARVNTTTADVSAPEGLPSFAGTGITRSGSRYFVGVGAEEGGIGVLDSGFESESFVEMPDVRDVDSYGNGGIVAVVGTEGSTSALGKVMVASDGDLGNAQTLDIVNFQSPFHKATVEVWGGRSGNRDIALLGLSEAGFKILDLNSPGSYVLEIDNPEASGTQLPNTNSASTDDDGTFVFTANGEYGFRMFRPNNQNFTGMDLIGFHRSDIDTDVLEEKYSANHVEYRDDYIFVASGTFGVLIYHTVVAGECTYTQGFWKNHEDVWPVNGLTLGTVDYTNEELLDILDTSVQTNGLVSLAHQLIAAKLNVAFGADDTDVAQAISDADALIGDLVVPPVGSGTLDPSETSALIDALADFNEGRTGPGHCDGSPTT